MNFVRGALNLWEDWRAIATMKDQSAPMPTKLEKHCRDARQGRFPQRLIELIQYAPIRKRFLPNLSSSSGMDHEVLHPRSFAQNSLVRYLTRAGFHGLHYFVEEPDRG